MTLCEENRTLIFSVFSVVKLFLEQLSPMLTAIVLDTNILFSALLSRQSRFANAILRGEARFFICDSVVVELFEHKDRIIRHSKHSETELLSTLRDLLRRIRVYQEELIAVRHWQTAFQLCQPIDPADTPHVALALQLDALLWTGDKRLKTALRQQGFDRFFEL